VTGKQLIVGIIQGITNGLMSGVVMTIMVFAMQSWWPLLTLSSQVIIFVLSIFFGVVKAWEEWT
jgi:hypothetical protein